MKKNKKILCVSASVVLLIALVIFIAFTIFRNLEKKESILSTIDYLEKNYGDGKFVIIKTEMENKNFVHSVETSYTDLAFKVTIDKDNKVIKENFIDVYGLEAFDLGTYKNVLELVYMTKMNELKDTINETLDATVNFQTTKISDNYGFYLQGKVPTKEDLTNSLELEQPSIKFNKTITSEEDLLNEIKKSIVLLKETFKDEKIKYSKKIVLYSFNNTTIDSSVLVDNGYIWISDYDEFDFVRVNMLNKNIEIKKSEL